MTFKIHDDLASLFWSLSLQISKFMTISLFVLIFIITHPSSLLVRCSADVGVIDCEDLISASETLTGVCRGKYLASGTKIFSNHCTCRRPSEDEGYKYPLPVLASHNVEAQTSALFVKDNLTRLPAEMFYIWCSLITMLLLPRWFCLFTVQKSSILLGINKI